MLHEQIEVPGTSLKLCYLSSRTQGYRSLLKVTMTPAVVSMGLLKVHLMVAVEGHLFQKWFHASPNLAYTYIWDKTDAYGQRVYGLSEAVGEWKGQTEEELCGCWGHFFSLWVESSTSNAARAMTEGESVN